MNIGIITLPLQNNYGGILQNYALQQVLMKMGHEPYTIRIKRPQGDKLWAFRWLIHDCRSIFAMFNGKSQGFIDPVYYYLSKNQAWPFKKFVKNHIQTTKLYDNNPVDVVREYELDALITGSDQVWRPKYNNHIKDQYLGFNENSSIKKIAYAASFGTSIWEYTAELESACRPLAQKLGAISVREQSGVELCRERFGVNAEWVLDPTMLLCREDYEKLCLQRQILEPYIFVYMLDARPELLLRIEDEAKRYKCKVVYKSADSSVTKDDSVEKWLSLIANSEMVFTDSFHATVFSMIFERQFITIINKVRGAARFDALSTFLPITDRIIESSEQFPISAIDYRQISSILKKEKERSIKWLESALMPFDR